VTSLSFRCSYFVLLTMARSARGVQWLGGFPGCGVDPRGCDFDCDTQQLLVLASGSTVVGGITALGATSPVAAWIDEGVFPDPPNF
jgi:hypothetical protein